MRGGRVLLGVKQDTIGMPMITIVSSVGVLRMLSRHPLPAFTPYNPVLIPLTPRPICVQSKRGQESWDMTWGGAGIAHEHVYRDGTYKKYNPELHMNS